MKVYIRDMLVAVEAVKEGVAVGEDKVSGLMFAGDFRGDIRNTRRIAETNREHTGEH